MTPRPVRGESLHLRHFTDSSTSSLSPASLPTLSQDRLVHGDGSGERGAGDHVQAERRDDEQGTPQTELSQQKLEERRQREPAGRVPGQDEAVHHGASRGEVARGDQDARRGGAPSADTCRGTRDVSRGRACGSTGPVPTHFCFCYGRRTGQTRSME